MRPVARIAREPNDAAIDRSVEDARWLVERAVDGTVSVTIDRGAYSLRHSGVVSSVRGRIAVDAEARDRTALDAATRDISSAQERGT